MYPDTTLGWFVGMFVIFFVLLVMAALAVWLDGKYQKHIEKHHGAPGDDEKDS